MAGNSARKENASQQGLAFYFWRKWTQRVADGINLGLGTESGTIADSEIAIGDVVGHDRIDNNTTINKPIRRSRQSNDDIRREVDKLEAEFNTFRDEFNKVNGRMVEVERLLGGQWGVGGMVAEFKQMLLTLDTMRADMSDIKFEIREDRHRDRRWSTIFLVAATILFVVALFMTINGLWRY